METVWRVGAGFDLRLNAGERQSESVMEAVPPADPAAEIAALKRRIAELEGDGAIAESAAPAHEADVLALLEAVRHCADPAAQQGELLRDDADETFSALAAAHPGLIADAAAFSPADFDAAIADLVGGIAQDEHIAFHFTDGISVGFILAPSSAGLRASQVGQLGGGLSVCLEQPTHLGWEQWGRGSFRATVGLELWGSKAADVLLASQREDGVDGKDCGKMDYVFVVKVKKNVLQRPDRRVIGRDCVSIIEKHDLVEHNGHHFLPKRDILRVFRLHNPNPTLQAELDKRDGLLKVVHEAQKLNGRVTTEAAAAALSVGESAQVVEEGSRVAVTVAAFDGERVIAERSDGRRICMGDTVAQARTTNTDAFNRVPIWTRCGGTLSATGGLVEAVEDTREWIVGTTWWGVAVAEGPGMSAGQTYCEFTMSRADDSSFSEQELANQSEFGFSHSPVDSSDVFWYLGVAKRGLEQEQEPYRSQDFFGMFLRPHAGSPGAVWNGGDYKRWDGMEGAGPGDTVGLLLDSDTGDLIVFKNGARLGVAIEGMLKGEFHWAVAFYEKGVRVEMEAKPPPESDGFGSAGESWYEIDAEVQLQTIPEMPQPVDEGLGAITTVAAEARAAPVGSETFAAATPAQMANAEADLEAALAEVRAYEEAKKRVEEHGKLLAKSFSGLQSRLGSLGEHGERDRDSPKTQSVDGIPTSHVSATEQREALSELKVLGHRQLIQRAESLPTIHDDAAELAPAVDRELLAKHTTAWESVDWATGDAAHDSIVQLVAETRTAFDESDDHFSAVSNAHWGLVDDGARFKTSEFTSNLAALEADILRDEQLAFHFADREVVASALAPGSLGLRAVQSGELGGGLAVTTEHIVTGLNWEKWGRGDFRQTCDAKLWGSSGEVLLASQRDDGTDGKDWQQLNYVFVLKVKRAAVNRQDRLLRGGSVCVIDKSDLAQHHGDHYLLSSHILKVYRIYNPNAALHADLDKRFEAEKWISSGNKKRVDLEAAAAGLSVGAMAWIVEKGERRPVQVVRFDRERVIAQRPVYGTLAPGLRVQVRWRTGRWFNATISSLEEGEGLSATYWIDWDDGNENCRLQPSENIRNADGSIPLRLPSEGDGEDICIGKTVSEALATSQGAFRRFPVFTRTGGMVVIDAHLGSEAIGGDIEYTVNWGCAVAEGPGMTNGLSYVEFECLSGARGVDGTDVPLYVGVARRGLSAAGDPCNSTDFWGLNLRTGTVAGTATSGEGRLWHAGEKICWDGMEGAGPGDVVGLLLDSDQGTLAVWKNGRYLGVAVAEGLTGELHWVTSFFGVDLRVRMTGKAPPGHDASAFNRGGEGWHVEHAHTVGRYKAA